MDLRRRHAHSRQDKFKSCKKEEKLMRYLSLRIFAVLASALAICPPAASAQAAILPANQAATPAPALYAELDRSSSSSVPAPLNSPADSVVTSQTPAGQPFESGARPFSGIAIGVKVGLAGAGFDVATPLVQRHLNLRGGASFITYAPNTFTIDNLNVNGSLKFQNAAVMVDFFPFHGRFRISGGATVFNNTALAATLSIPTGQSFSVGGTDYFSEPYNAVTNPAGPITGSGTFTFGGSKVAPRFTIGTGNMLPGRGRFTFESEIGFQYFSEPVIVYNISGTGCQNYSAGVYSNCGPIPQSNVISEQNMLQNDLTDLRFFPVFSLGLSYKIH
jgi:hypothetical protein